MKEIYCFGTSQTAGGGYEFDAPSKWDWPEEYWFIEYEGEKTQSNFSYPGRLQSISDEYKVFNMGKSGHGNDRSIRKAYDVIKSKTNEELKNVCFVFEYAYVGRKEVFLKNLDKYAICNYSFLTEKMDKVKLMGLAIDYFYDDEDTDKLLRMNRDSIQDYLSKTLKYDVETKKLEREFSIFLSFLENMGIKFLLLSGWPDFRDNHFQKNAIAWDKLTPYKANPFGMAAHEETITSETNGEITDAHNNYTINNWISKVVYNRLINDKFLNNLSRIPDEYPYKRVTIQNP
jgi:hypothetical protein|tara:strand:- start:207 stop:1070 length:864 start_codon:yes stop_codon:yes gene_type:complete